MASSQLRQGVVLRPEPAPNDEAPAGAARVSGSSRAIERRPRSGWATRPAATIGPVFRGANDAIAHPGPMPLREDPASPRSPPREAGGMPGVRCGQPGATGAARTGRGPNRPTGALVEGRWDLLARVPRFAPDR